MRPASRLAALAAVTVIGSSCALPDRHLDPRLACDGGACACSAGFGDCDGNPANGCETSLLAGDAKNCGACGRSCLGGACKAGKCDPVVVYDFGSQGAPIPAAFVLGGGLMYIGNCSIMPSIGSVPTGSVPPGGGALTPIVSDACVKQVATDGGTLFWGANVSGPSMPGIWALSLGSPEQSKVELSMSASVLDYFTAAGGYVYWQDHVDGAPGYSLSRVDVAGGTPEVVKTLTQAIHGLAADGDRVYWSDQDGIESMPHAGTPGKPTTLVANELANGGMSLANGALFWSSVDQGPAIVRLTLQNGLASGPPERISVDGDPREIAVDEAHAYFLDFNTHRRVARVALGGGPVEVLASEVDLGDPIAVALDAQAVYFKTSSMVLRVAK